MVRIAPLSASNPEAVPGAAIGFLQRNAVRWGFEFDNLQHVVSLRHGGAKTAMGSFENDGWYEVLLQASADGTRMYFEVVDVGGIRVNLGTKLVSESCEVLTISNPPHLRCHIGLETIGTGTWNMSSKVPVPQSVDYDEFSACQ